MLNNLTTALIAFLMTAAFSSGVTLAPISVAWTSIWVYVTFVLCLIPSVFIAPTLLAVCLIISALIGGVVIAGTAGVVALYTGTVRKFNSNRTAAKVKKLREGLK